MTDPAHEKPVPNSQKWKLSQSMLGYCIEIFKRQGRSFRFCDQCGRPTKGHPELHHTRYEGATIHDLEIVCQSCNRLAVNRGLP